MGDPNVLDVTEPSHFTQLKDLIAANDITIVLFWADYCGHCDVYKQKVWNKLKAMPNKKAGLASIHYDQVENSPLSAAKYTGYPSIIYVNKNGTMREFKDEEGAKSNSITTDAANNLEYMKSVVQGQSPTGVQGRSPTGVQGRSPTGVQGRKTTGAEDIIENSENDPTPAFSDQADATRQMTTKADVRNTLLKAPPATTFVIPPNTEADNTKPTAGRGASVGGGAGQRGSLYEFLLSMQASNGHRTKKQTHKKRSKRKAKRRSRKN
jgi:thiol-disulfide isomerase/thioredoxin